MTAKKINLWSTLIPMLMVALIGLLAGGVLHQWGWGLAIGLLAYELYFLLMLQRFKNWATRHTDEPPPNFETNLDIIASSLYQINRQEQQAHQQTIELVKKIRQSMGAMNDAIILIDERDCLLWWNKSANRMLSLTPSDKNRHILTIIRNPLFHQYYHHTEDFLDGIRLTHWQDAERFVQCEITQFGQEKLMMIYDVTRMQHLEQMRKDFVANVSHELRTPLTVIMGYVETLSEQPDIDPRWQRAFGQMMQQSHRMNNIINDLLLLSRLENNEKPREPVNVDMPKLLTQLFDDAQMYNKNFDHLIHLHIDSQQHILGYEDYLRSALSNLITNAIKYTPQGGEISISWHNCDDGVCFSVEDNGIGIEPRHIERLTERFYRVDSGRSRETGGTGLGLAIVKHVLYQHHAKLKVDSKVGKGSTFTIEFPHSSLVD
ncbi:MULTISPECIES: phosphate regulon sensor histidine kinase PhoR [unclassified Moraxella]|uniref:phosphate regulon sensor histidine kinase PhoR n=1 Tax=unclassified Moraxella TaxID=2685852 RepID=UPI003AF7BFFD